MAVRPDTTIAEPPPAGNGTPAAPLDAVVADTDAHLDAVAAAARQAVAAAAAARREAVAGPIEDSEPVGNALQTLAAFYDRRAPAALAYCARICEPETIADAVEEAFGHVFDSAARGEDHLDELLRGALQEAVADRAPDDPETAGRLLAEAERAYEALSGDDAPALGRSLLGEMLSAAEPTAAAAPAAAGPPVGEPPAAGPPLAEPRVGPPPAPPKPEPAAQSSPADEPEPVAEAATSKAPRLGHGWRRRLVIILAVIGTLLLAEAVVTLVWKEPFTGYLAARAQDDLDKQLDKREVGLNATDERSLAAIDDAGARSRERMSLLARHLDEEVPEGQALGRIQIGKIDVDYVFVQGTEGATLRKGPGHYHGVTKLPGQGGVVGIAGHRTTYEAPFREIDELKAGDHITLRMPYGRFTYEVTGHRIVPSDYTEGFDPARAGSGDRLVLSACHPLYSATERILVDAKLVASEPLGSAVETTSVPAVPTASPEQIARRRTRARLKALGDRPLGPGTTGSDVRELQRLLGMPVTGTFDANTTAAVLAFQRDHDLPQVGVVGSQTKRALARREHPPSTPPTPADVPQQKPPSGSTTTTPSTTPYQSPQPTQPDYGGSP
jgi:sortase A